MVICGCRRVFVFPKNDDSVSKTGQNNVCFFIKVARQKGEKYAYRNEKRKV